MDALNNTEELMMFVLLITAFLYMFTPCVMILPIHFCKNKCNMRIFARIQMCYDYVTVGFCGTITLSFLGLIGYYIIGKLLQHFPAEAWVLVIAIMVGSLSSFVDLLFFEIFRYSRNPFMNIFKVGCCCCYKLCCVESTEEEKQTYLEQFRTDSLSQRSDFIQM